MEQRPAPQTSSRPSCSKYAGPAMPPTLATLQADMACARHVPLAATDGLMTYIYKKRNLPRNTLNSYRGIRVTSSAGKLCCRALADPIFPVLSDYAEALGPEQFAGRKHHSADMLAVLLDMIISMHGSAPVYIILLDVSKAFDRTWREAIWAKMLAQGHPPQVVAWLRQAYHRLRTAVKSGDARSAFVDAMIGIGQGDPNSTPFFSLLLSDLPAHLHNRGIRTEWLGLALTCLVFLDDVATVVHTEEQVCKALDAYAQYESMWHVEFSREQGKGGVLAINVASPPASWAFGHGSISTIEQDKYLATRLSASRSPAPHYEVRLRSARGQLKSMQASGLMGGHHPGAQSSLLASACIWPVLNAGRPAVPLYVHTDEAAHIRGTLDSFRKEVGISILGVPARTPSEGVLGELGWSPDMEAANVQHLGLFGCFMRAPTQSLPNGFMGRLLTLASRSPQLCPPFVRHALDLIAAYGLDISQAASASWKEQVKQAARRAASARWRTHVTSLPSLAAAYPDAEGLGMAAYLRMPAFKGRQLLAQTRLNALPFGAVETDTPLGTCSVCKMQAQDAREHFLFQCPPLQAVRDAHAHIPLLRRDCALALPLRTSQLLHSARARPSVHATQQQMAQSRAVGAFLHDLFHTRQHFMGRPPDPSFMPRT